MKKLLLVGVVGLSALLGGCSSFVEYTMEPPRQAYPDQTPLVTPYGASDHKVGDMARTRSSSGQAGNRGSTRGQANANK